MTQDEFSDLIPDLEASPEIARALPHSRGALSEERTGAGLLQHQLFQWIDELTL